MNVHDTPSTGGLSLEQLASLAQRALAGAGYSRQGQ
jgi:hypothetical protein